MLHILDELPINSQTFCRQFDRISFLTSKIKPKNPNKNFVAQISFKRLIQTEDLAVYTRSHFQPMHSDSLPAEKKGMDKREKEKRYIHSIILPTC